VKIEARIGLAVKLEYREVPLRQSQVLNGICMGKGNKEIASELHISERTVKWHVSKLLLIFGGTNRYDLCRLKALQPN
jgi:DNA-binding NarL/FixJ family response regulator